MSESTRCIAEFCAVSMAFAAVFNVRNIVNNNIELGLSSAPIFLFATYRFILSVRVYHRRIRLRPINTLNPGYRVAEANCWAPAPPSWFFLLVCEPVLFPLAVAERGGSRLIRRDHRLRDPLRRW